MKVAIVLRGHHEKHENERKDIASNSFCFTKLLDHFKVNVLRPLQQLYGVDNVRVFFITYESHEIEVIRDVLDVSAEHVFLRPKNSSTQSKMLSQGLLELLPFLKEYDLFYILRFDIAYKKPITEWNVCSNSGRVFWFPWRESELLWNRAKRVSDLFHVISGGFETLQCFLKCLLVHANTYNCMHQIYRELTSALGSESAIGFICPDGFFDSNTGIDNKSCRKNPVCILSQRGYFHDDFEDPAGGGSTKFDDVTS